MSWRRLHGERGSVTIVTAGIVAIMVVLTLGAADLGAVLVARERARAAADSAALAAAQELAMPSTSSPQDLAADYAERNGGSLVSCSCEPGTQEAGVGVSIPVGHLFLFPGDHTVMAQARAVVEIPV